MQGRICCPNCGNRDIQAQNITDVKTSGKNYCLYAQDAPVRLSDILSEALRIYSLSFRPLLR